MAKCIQYVASPKHMARVDNDTATEAVRSGQAVYVSKSIFARWQERQEDGKEARA